jgi:hypothetical protein
MSIGRRDCRSCDERSSHPFSSPGRSSLPPPACQAQDRDAARSRTGRHDVYANMRDATLAWPRVNSDTHSGQLSTPRQFSPL